uniref:Ig-like domain-containing protein n=1 Tax=Anabas testudineus TaxID=64144 RepID=A0A7N6FJ63_ANATE
MLQSPHQKHIHFKQAANTELLLDTRLLPSRSQFFQYDSVSLSCDQLGNSSVWRVMRNTSTKINEECTKSNNTTNDSTCFITDLYPSDSGVYWCESAAGRCSKTIHITVTAGSVILESPAHPVMEGEDVTLTCTSKETSSSNLTAHFYKDRLFIGSSSTGNLTIHRVSKADEGLYKCSISGAGESPDGQLRTIGEIRLKRPENLLLIIDIHSLLIYLNKLFYHVTQFARYRCSRTCFSLS